MLMLTIIVTIISMVIINRFVMSYYINTGKFDNKINMFIGNVKRLKREIYLTVLNIILH